MIRKLILKIKDVWEYKPSQITDEQQIALKEMDGTDIFGERKTMKIKAK